MAVRQATSLGGRRATTWSRYVRPVLPFLIALYVPILLLLATTRWVLHNRAPNVVEPISLDMAATLEHSSFVVLEILLWACAAISAVVGARRASARGDHSFTRLCAGAGLLSVLFLADDLFQLHKPVVPDATRIPSSLLLMAASGLVLVWLVASRVEIARTEAGILAAALMLFALWLVYKLGLGLPAETPVEISAKLCGIAGWTLYVWRTSLRTSPH